MKKTLSLLMFLLVLTTVHAQGPLDYQDTTLSVDLSNKIEINPKSSNYKVERLEARLSWIPRESYRQQVISVNTEPESNSIGDELSFVWTYPREKELWIRVSSTVKTNSDYFPIRDKVDFPIEEVPAELSIYLKEQEIIDFNQGIRRKASELAEGRDDLYEVVFEIAEWVNNNINYSLDTVTADASQKSSWVLQNRRGVCDEMTSLFISMLRTLGIPARFVYGEAYTNIGVYDDNWGGHGWAEVYFPDHGWVPFDPTYGEYGYLDAGHVKMGQSIDARRPSLKYSVKARDVQIGSGYLDIDSDIIRTGPRLNPGIEVRPSFYYDQVGYESYNLLTVNLKNNENIYKPVVLQLADPAEVDVIDDTPRHILLKPGAEAKVYWLVKTGTLQARYIYTFPFRITTDKGLSYNATFQAEEEGQVYGKAIFESMMKTSQEALKKPYSQEVSLDCQASPSNIYVGEEVSVKCELVNEGGKNLQRLNVCLQQDCTSHDLEAGDKEVFSYTLSYKSTGVKNIIVTAENEEVSKSSYSKVNVIDEAGIGINIKAPEEADYGENVKVKFNITKNSKSTPRNLVVRLHFQGSYQEWEIDSLDSVNKFDVSVDTRGFTFTNDFKVTVDYEDDVGQEYHQEKEIQVGLEDLSWKEWIVVALNTLGYKVVSLFS